MSNLGKGILVGCLLLALVLLMDQCTLLRPVGAQGPEGQVFLPLVGKSGGGPPLTDAWVIDASPDGRWLAVGNRWQVAVVSVEDATQPGGVHWLGGEPLVESWDWAMVEMPPPDEGITPVLFILRGGTISVYFPEENRWWDFCPGLPTPPLPACLELIIPTPTATPSNN